MCVGRTSSLLKVLALLSSKTPWQSTEQPARAAGLSTRHD